MDGNLEGFCLHVRGLWSYRRENLFLKPKPQFVFYTSAFASNTIKTLAIKISSYGLVFLWKLPWKYAFFSLITQNWFSEKNSLIARCLFFPNGGFSPDNLYLLSPRVVAPSRPFTDMTPYAFDDTYESSPDDDYTALAISRSIWDRIIPGINSTREWKNEENKKRVEASYLETSLKSFADYKQSNGVDAWIEWCHV